MPDKGDAAAALPDERGQFGPYGGRFVPETLMAPLEELTRAYLEAKADPAFQRELDYHLRSYAGRPTPVYCCRRLTEAWGGAKVYLKREDLAHTGAHKINNTLGQAILTRRMGKRRVIAETGAGQHGVATAVAAALFGFECDVYMGEEDMRRQSLNVFRMKLLGTRVVPVKTGARTLKDAMNEAMRDWMATVGHTHYIIGSVAGPHPYPMMVRDFQSVIGKETRRQIRAKEGRLPDCILACVGGGSNAAGIFYPFVEDPGVALLGVEAGGRSERTGEHAATLGFGRPGVLHGMYTYVLQDDDGQTSPVHSVSAGLDYPGVGPEHSYWKETGRVQYTHATDAETLDAFDTLARTEGILGALESCHAVAQALQRAGAMRPDQAIVVNLSGRGDKDTQEVARLRGETFG